MGVGFSSRRHRYRHRGPGCRWWATDGRSNSAPDVCHASLLFTFQKVSSKTSSGALESVHDEARTGYLRTDNDLERSLSSGGYFYDYGSLGPTRGGVVFADDPPPPIGRRFPMLRTRSIIDSPTWGGHRGLVVGVFDCVPTGRRFASALCRSTLTLTSPWSMTG